MLTKRQKIGVALMVASVLTAILVQLCTGKVANVHTLHEDVLTSGSKTMELDFSFNWHYGVPLLICFVAGLVCLVLPPRKPPRLN